MIAVLAEGSMNMTIFTYPLSHVVPPGPGEECCPATLSAVNGELFQECQCEVFHQLSIPLLEVFKIDIFK